MTVTDPAALERVSFFAGQLLTADDLLAEQAYHRWQRRRHNRHLHGWGVSCGCAVVAAPTAEQPWRVRVEPGHAVSAQGDEIAVTAPLYVDLAGGTPAPEEPCQPCPPVGIVPLPGRVEPVYVAIRSRECRVRPVRLHPAGCGCDDAACDYSRVREAAEPGVLWEPGAAYEEAAAADAAWRALVASRPGLPLPVPDCPPVTDDPWVVLAAVTVPAAAADPVAQAAIDPSVRRVLLATQRLQQALDTAAPVAGLEPGWAWCNRCQCVYFGPLVAESRCPVGGAHRPAADSASPRYGLSTVAIPSSQANWRQCSTCRTLVFGGAVGVCPQTGGGPHDVTGSADYRIRHGAPAVPGAQTEWRWCRKCQAMAFEPAQATSTCAAGGRHDSTGSGYYSLLFMG